MLYCIRNRKKEEIPTEKAKLCLRLFLAFLKIGAFTFGGGYAMIPLIEREVCEKRGWVEKDDMLEIVAIAESTPGPIAINAATYVGSRVSGLPGAAAATLGVVLPSFLIIFCLSFALERFSALRAVRYAFFGVRAGVLALVLKALVSMYKKCPRSAFSYVVMGLAFLAVAFGGVNAVWVVLGAAVSGLVYALVTAGRAKA